MSVAKEDRGIRCRKCGHTRYRVYGTQALANGTIRRYRQCLKCGAKRRTSEQ